MNLNGNLYSRKFNTRAQAMLEYGVLICVIVAALIAMQVYFRRGLQGKVKGTTDEISGGTAYVPGATTANILVSKQINEMSNSTTTGNSYDFNFLNHAVTTSKNTINSTQEVNRSEATGDF